MRLSRKNWTAKEMGLLGASLTDLLDSAVKETFRINDQELDYICDNASDKELSAILYNEETFAARRKCLVTLFKFLNQYKNSH